MQKETLMLGKTNGWTRKEGTRMAPTFFFTPKLINWKILACSREPWVCRYFLGITWIDSLSVPATLVPHVLSDTYSFSSMFWIHSRYSCLVKQPLGLFSFSNFLAPSPWMFYDNKFTEISGKGKQNRQPFCYFFLTTTSSPLLNCLTKVFRLDY